MITQLGYIGFGVKDLAVWEDYATNVLGHAVQEKLGDGTMYLRMDEYHHRLIVEPTGEDDLKYVGWMVKDNDALNELRDRLEAAGVEVEEASPEECYYRRVRRFIAFKDTNDVRQEAFVGLEVMGRDPFRSPRNISGWHAGNLGLGHISWKTEDVDETERFFRDILGFKISDYITFIGPDSPPRRIVFFHVNPRHHSFNITSFHHNPGKLGHIMMQQKTIDDVGQTYDIVRERKIPLVMELGRHNNDRMLSFYMQTPSGFTIEIGADGREIDDDTWVVQQYYTGDIWGHQRPQRAEAR